MSKASEKAELTKVPLIGEILVKGDYLSEEMKNKIVASVNDENNKGKFFGQVIKEAGIDIPKDKFDQALFDQSQMKAEAALKDAAALVAGNNLDFGNLKPHWGNGGVPNAPIKDPSIIDGASAAGNLAQLIVLVANNAVKNYQPKGKEGFLKAVEAAANLTFAIKLGSKENLQLNQAVDWSKLAKRTLLSIIDGDQRSVETAQDYIKNRFIEIDSAVVKSTKLLAEAQNISASLTTPSSSSSHVDTLNQQRAAATDKGYFSK